METGNHFYLIDWIVLFGYFAATMGIGVYFWRRSRSTEGFTAANRSLPGWLCGLSIFATFVSSISYLALPGKSFAGNWNPFVFSLSIPLVTWIAVRYFLPYYRSGGDVSAYALLERRFGLWARIYASVFYLFTQVARIGVVMYLMALPMQVIFGWNIYTVLLATGVCVTLYSFVGGIVAVIWTDAIQAVVLMGGALLALGVMLFKMPGGVVQVFETAAEYDKFSLGSFGPSLLESTFWVVLVYGIVGNLQNFGVDQSYVQRYIAASDDREARRSLWLGGLLYVPVSALFFFIGVALFTFYGAAGSAQESAQGSDIQEVKLIVARQRLLQQGRSVEDPDFRQRQSDVADKLQLSEVGDRVFPHFIAKHLPPGLTGLLIAAVFAAAMSTVSTSLNSSATLVMSDFYRRLLNPGASERASMFALYAATIVFGVLGTLMSLWLVKLTDSALDIWWTLAGILGGGTTGLFLLGMISRRARSPAAIAGVIAGMIVIGWLSLPKLLEYLLRLSPQNPLHTLAASIQASTAAWSSPLHAYLTPVIGTLVILLVGIIFAQFSKRDATASAALPN